MSRPKKAPRPAVTVKIAGERHVLRSDAPPEYTRAVAEHVDETIRKQLKQQPLEPHRTAILAALFITDELFRAKEEIRRLRAEIESRAAAAAGRLEQALAAETLSEAESVPARPALPESAPEPRS
jgi:cell division protein ZapA